MVIQNFVVFEGGDGSGTTTQLMSLSDRFAAVKTAPRLYTTFEPTDGPIGRLIRSALKGTIPLQSETLARLFAADRNEHLYAPGGIWERCSQGELVVSDRYVLSSLVYQGIDCGEALPQVLNARFPVPAVLFFFDVDPAIALKRVENRPVKEIYEYLDFQIQVRERYKALLPWYEQQGVQVEIIDAGREAEEVGERLWRILEKMPILGSS